MPSRGRVCSWSRLKATLSSSKDSQRGDKGRTEPNLDSCAQNKQTAHRGYILDGLHVGFPLYHKNLTHWRQIKVLSKFQKPFRHSKITAYKARLLSDYFPRCAEQSEKSSIVLVVKVSSVTPDTTATRLDSMESLAQPASSTQPMRMRLTLTLCDRTNSDYAHSVGISKCIDPVTFLHAQDSTSRWKSISLTSAPSP